MAESERELARRLTRGWSWWSLRILTSPGLRQVRTHRQRMSNEAHQLSSSSCSPAFMHARSHARHPLLLAPGGRACVPLTAVSEPLAQRERPRPVRLDLVIVVEARKDSAHVRSDAAGDVSFDGQREPSRCDQLLRRSRGGHSQGQTRRTDAGGCPGMHLDCSNRFTSWTQSSHYTAILELRRPEALRYSPPQQSVCCACPVARHMHAASVIECAKASTGFAGGCRTTELAPDARRASLAAARSMFARLIAMLPRRGRMIPPTLHAMLSARNLAFAILNTSANPRSSSRVHSGLPSLCVVVGGGPAPSLSFSPSAGWGIRNASRSAATCALLRPATKVTYLSLGKRVSYRAFKVCGRGGKERG